MKANWFFKKYNPGDKVRDPIQGEFFSTAAIRNPAEALIREGIQNSLDARLGCGPVRIRIYLSENEGALTPDTHSRYFDGSWVHFGAKGNGLRKPPHPDSPCTYLVFEDFGTTGLQGDTEQWFDKPGSKNSFFYFFRAEGRSGKSDKDRGRWGIGKYVFPRSSQINSFFGLTIRADDKKRLLMGQCVLKSHSINDGNDFFTPDGLCGIADNGCVIPFEEQDLIDRFSEDFQLTRKDESGLSVVIPWNDPDFTLTSLVEGVISDYFHPILSAKLEVEIASGEQSITLDSSNLIDALDSVKSAVIEELIPSIKLSKWALELDQQSIPILNSPEPNRAPKWSQGLITEDLVSSIKGRLEENLPVSLRVPVYVHKNDEGSQLSHFDVFMARSENEPGNPVFIRDGIIISDVRKARARGIRSIVVIDDNPLSSMLGDSENPAHTQWQRDGSNFKGKYKYGPSTIDFIVKSVYEINKAISKLDQEEDPMLLADIFSLPSEEEGSKAKKATFKKPKKGKKPPIIDIPPRPRPKLINVNKVAGGFTVTSGIDFSPSAILDIRVAYDVRRGNPIKKYDLSDFELDKDPITILPDKQGVEILSMEKNMITLKAVESHFKITVTGFDEHRDLYIRCIRKGN